MNVARDPAELEPRPRSVAIGTFDGVHLGHRAVIGAAPTGHARRSSRSIRIRASCSAKRVIPARNARAAARAARRSRAPRTSSWSISPPSWRRSPPRSSRRATCSRSARSVVVGRSRVPLRPQARRRPRPSPVARPGRASRCRSSRGCRRHGSAGSPPPARWRAPRRCSDVRSSWTGPSSRGDQRGGTLGFPTANLDVAGRIVVPSSASTQGRDDRRAAVSIGVNPHYGGSERRIEAFLLDWGGDLYGGGWCSSCGSGCATSGRSRARPPWSSRSPATSSRPAPRPSRLAPTSFPP